jgi:hypothetical protein
MAGRDSVIVNLPERALEGRVATARRLFSTKRLIRPPEEEAKKKGRF